jgi:hypothetical protein
MKNATLLALWGALLLTIVLAASLIRNVFGVVEGILPAMALIQSVIYTFAGLTAVFFLYMFHKQQF